MLCFNIRDLESRAESVEGTLEAHDAVWADNDVRPLHHGVRVQGRLSAAGSGRFYFSGTLEGIAASSCRRCLADIEVRVSEAVQVLFAESGIDEAEEDDVVPIAAGDRELDMRPAVREEWLLAVPPFALCRENCKGICPSCGSDLNSGACDCAPPVDARWRGLRETRSPQT